MHSNENLFTALKLSAAVASAFAVCAPAAAQVPGPSPAAGVLSGIPGLNEAQRPTAVAIETLCPFLPSPNREGTNTERLSDSCTRMVSTTINRGEPGTAGPFDMGLSDAELATGLQAMAGEEMSAQGRLATDTSPRNAIYGRLLALRSGGRGLLLAGSSLKVDGQVLTAAQLLPAGSRGGGAAADGLGSRWGGFINGSYSTGDRDASGREDAFDYDDYGVTAGVDYRFSDALVGGVALSYSRTEADFDRNLGGVESDNWAASLYGSYTMGAWYVDAHAAYARVDFDTTRRIRIVSQTTSAGIDTTATGNTDGDQWSFDLGAGYDMAMGNATLTPYGRLSYLKLEVDGFTEREPNAGLALDIQDRDTTSVQSALGARISTPVSTGFGVLTPYAALEWNHEFDNDSGSLVAKYAHDPFNTFFTIPTDEPDRNFFTASVGMAAVLQGGLSAFVNVDSVFGLRDTSNYGLVVGVRGEF